MPIRHRKGRGIVARTRIPTRAKPHYLAVYLWESCKAMEAGASSDFGDCQPKPQEIRRDGESTGLCTLSRYTVEIDENGNEVARVAERLLLAEIHLVKNRWCEESVAHELMHALLHRVRVLGPTPDDVLFQNDGAEELLCYEYGEWFSRVWSWLWQVNPYGVNAGAA